MKAKRVRKPKKQKVRQGHKLVWFTLLIIFLPFAIVGYVLLTSYGSSGKPVEGSRFSSSDLTPRISQAEIDLVQNQLLDLPGVESVTINMNSATLRIHLNLWDGASYEEIEYNAQNVYDVVNNLLPIDTYFTNTEDSKNYDLEIDAYNYIVDDTHPADGQIYIKITKTGAGGKVVDVITQAKDPELVEQIMTPSYPVEEEPVEESPEENTDDYYYTEYGYYDSYGNFYYYE